MKRYLLQGINLAAMVTLILMVACRSNGQKSGQMEKPAKSIEEGGARYLVRNLYIADPSAHVFDGKIFVYPSHDIDSGIPENDNGGHFAMRDYHVFSLDSIEGKVTGLQGCVHDCGHLL